jgi:hypothetical protein
MAEVGQYTFDWSEVAELLIKKLNIHEGEWLASIEFTINAGIVGPSPSDTKPGMLLVANKVQLARAPANSPPHLVVDAAKVNPAS